MSSSRRVFSSAAARAGKGVVFSDDDDEEEEPGEEIDSNPTLKVGEEREIPGAGGTRKKLLKQGNGWMSPAPGDEVTVLYSGTLLDGTLVRSTGDGGGPVTLKLGSGDVEPGLNECIVTMKMGERALFTLPSSCGVDVGMNSVATGSHRKFEVELVSWISVVDVCKDGGIIKRILVRGDGGRPGDLDQVTVRYKVMLPDAMTAAESSANGVEFFINEGHFCSAFAKVITTMNKGEKASVTVQPQYAFGNLGSDAANGFAAIPSNVALNIDLELVSFKHVVNVSGDFGVLKKILKEGKRGCKPSDGEPVQVKYTGMLEDGTVFERFGFDDTGCFHFVIGADHVIDGLNRAAATMAKGEISVLTIKPEYGYGVIEVKRDLAMIPAYSTLIMEVEMVDFLKEKEPWELNCQERLEAVQRLKENGNDLFKTNKYHRAAKKYAKALEYLDSDEVTDSVEEQKVKSLRVLCWLNSAACSLKLKEFRDAINSCTKVLEIESSNVKALYRRAQAYIETFDLYLANLDIKKSLEIDPQNRDAVLLNRKLRELKAVYDKKDAKLYKNMFEQGNKIASPEAKRLKTEEMARPANMERDNVQQKQSIASPASSVEAMVVDPSLP